MTDKILPAIEPEALYNKSRIYIQRGFRAQSAGDIDEYQLWASLALELLGKAALSSVHPSLVVDPNHHQSLFAASGRVISSDIKTITAKTLYSRIGLLDKAFDKRHQTFCEQISLRRNAEIHSGASPFSGMKPDAWEREFWSAAKCILEIQSETLESWLGAEQAHAPNEVVRKAEEALEWAIKDRIERHRADFSNDHKDPKKLQKAVEDSKLLLWQNHIKLFRELPDDCESTVCPSCQSHGFLAGTIWHEEVRDYDTIEHEYQHFTELVVTVFGTQEFVCPTCKLKLFGADELSAAGLPEEFEMEAERELEFEPDYGND